MNRRGIWPQKGARGSKKRCRNANCPFCAFCRFDIILDNSNDNNVMSVSLLRLKDGRLALFNLVKNSWLDCRPRVRYSSDEAAAWSEPILVVDATGYFILNNDRVAQLESGRIIAPLAFHRSRSSEPNNGKSFDSRAIDLWYYSDDAGQTGCRLTNFLPSAP
jgi:sialidase-1